MNRVMVMGRAGSDAELRHTQGGMAICKFSLATSKKYKDRDGVEQEETEWHRCKLFQKRAENLAKYIKKGGMYAIEGRLKTGEWEKDGNKFQMTEIMVDEFHFCGGGGGGQRGGTGGGTEGLSDDDIPF